MEKIIKIEELQNPNRGGDKDSSMAKPKVVVIMGPTGSGKSRLAIDLASHFPVEIINADSMQVYHGLDVLTNKVTIAEQKGVPHHLLGTIGTNVEFTSKDFRDAAIPGMELGYRDYGVPKNCRYTTHTFDRDARCSLCIAGYLKSSDRVGIIKGMEEFRTIHDILSRNHLPLIVGGTNFYIQALLSPFLLDDSAQDLSNNCLNDTSANRQEQEPGVGEDGDNYSYDRLRALDPVAANRLHPNDHRRIRQYLELFAHSGTLPSKLFQGKMLENWGRLGVYSRYDCCFICVDASLPVLDRYVNQRVDCMIEAGLLEEVYDIYTLNADYRRGLRQAIGVREFEDFLRTFLLESRGERNSLSEVSTSRTSTGNSPRQNMREVLKSSVDIPHKALLEEGIDKLKVNTQRLVRRQKRRINRLQTLFGWNIHYVDSTESLLGSSEDAWMTQVVEPAANIIGAFLNSDSIPCNEDIDVRKLEERDLWTRYICEACGDRVLRGAHEWEQHKQGRSHRKRIASLRKRRGSLNSLTSAS